MNARAGFTLIEILAVILILGILATILLTQLGGAEEAVRVQTTAQRLAKVEAAIEHYAREFGGYPPSSFQGDQEVANDGTNVGCEALVVALWSRKWDAGGLLGEVVDALVNTDEDSSPKPQTDFGNRALLEIPDDWGNPIAYIERTDYGVTGRPYLTYDGETGVELESAPVAFKNSRTGLFYQAQKFQLVSAGPDGEFGTEDDITTFERN
jgi:prepilin-type N-terminal cleavage/methylation domain-containing protein